VFNSDSLCTGNIYTTCMTKISIICPVCLFLRYLLGISVKCQHGTLVENTLMTSAEQQKVPSGFFVRQWRLRLLLQNFQSSLIVLELGYHRVSCRRCHDCCHGPALSCSLTLYRLFHLLAVTVEVRDERERLLLRRF